MTLKPHKNELPLVEDYYGHFDNDGRDYVITRPNPLKPWVNVHWNRNGYEMQVTQTGAGYSKQGVAPDKFCRLNKGFHRYLYLYDQKSGRAWNPGWAPMLVDVENFTCVHSQAYTQISSRYNGIEASWRLFVPIDGYHEVWTVKVKNASHRSRRLSVFPYFPLDMQGFKTFMYYAIDFNYMEAFWEEQVNGIVCPNENPMRPNNRFTGYMVSSEPVSGYEGLDENFVGRYSTPQQPEALKRGYCTNQGGSVEPICMALQIDLELAPGAEKKMHFLIGVAESIEEIEQVRSKRLAPGRIERDLEAAKAWHNSFAGRVSIDTPDKKLNYLVNHWLKKQNRYCLEVRDGVRDVLQIADGAILADPQRVREKILQMASYQYADGHCVRAWCPLNELWFSDQQIWLEMTVVNYVRETGDKAILEEMVSYYDKEQASLYDHLKVGMEKMCKDLGEHGLCLMRYADWNDSLNFAPETNAESVWNTMATCYAILEMMELAEYVGESAYKTWLKQQYTKLKQTINEVAWDGDWYVRVLYAGDKMIGSKKNAHGQLFMNAQSWAVISGIAEGERVEKCVKAIRQLEIEDGLLLMKPPYEKFDPEIGRASSIKPGMVENAGIYNHGAAFKALMDCMLGLGDDAYRTLVKIMGDHRYNPSTKTGLEPFVLCSCYYQHRFFIHRVNHGWTTGTAPWFLKVATEWILGMRRDWNGLRIDPCLPSDWTKVRGSREFRGSRYQINITKPQGICKGVKKITVDGSDIEGTLLPLFHDGEVHVVEVEMESF